MTVRTKLSPASDRNDVSNVLLVLPVSERILQNRTSLLSPKIPGHRMLNLLKLQYQDKSSLFILLLRRRRNLLFSWFWFFNSNTITAKCGWYIKSRYAFLFFSYIVIESVLPMKDDCKKSSPQRPPVRWMCTYRAILLYWNDDESSF